MESVHQQYFRDFEHIILDGGSTDDTLKIVADWQLQHPNIRLDTGKDKGVYDAMNKGIAMATGEWLYFLGADDYFYQANSLELIVPFLQKNEARIVYGDVYFESLGRLYDHRFDIEKILKANICHQAVFYHADVFKQIGGYDLNYRIAADYDFNLKCWLSGSIQYEYAPVTVAYYSSGGLSSVNKDESFIKDFPAHTIAATLTSNRPITGKINILSKIYRKIIQRPQYNAIVVSRNLFVSPGILIRLLAFIWMCLSSPLYGLRKKTKSG